MIPRVRYADRRAFDLNEAEMEREHYAGVDAERVRLARVAAFDAMASKARVSHNDGKDRFGVIVRVLDDKALVQEDPPTGSREWVDVIKLTIGGTT